MNTLGKVLAGICAALFVITGAAALLLFNIERRAFSADTYKQAFENQGLYEQMPGILSHALVNSPAEAEGAEGLLRSIDAGGWESILAFLIPPEELKALGDDALDSIFDYLNGKTDSAAVSLLPFKRHLVSPAGVEAVLGIMRSQPDCTLEQVVQMTLGAIGGNELVLCNPPEDVVGILTPLIEAQLQFLTITFPDKLTLISDEKSGTPDDPRLGLNRARALMKLTPLFPLFFLLGMTILAVRSPTGWLRWWGWSLLLTGMVGALIALMGSPIVGSIFQRALRGRAAGVIPPVLFSTLNETVSAVARQMLKPVAFEGLILLLLGAAMLGTALYQAKRMNRQAAPVQNQ